MSHEVRHVSANGYGDAALSRQAPVGLIAAVGRLGLPRIAWILRTRFRDWAERWWKPDVDWLPPARMKARATEALAERVSSLHRGGLWEHVPPLGDAFEFAGHRVRFDEVDFATAVDDPLWDLELHSFRATVPSVLGSVEKRTCFFRWIRKWRSEADNLGIWAAWHPYSTSVRSIEWLLGTALQEGLEDNHQDPSLVALLPTQLDRIRTRLEIHLSGNHLVKNGAALWLGGVMLEHPSAAGWRSIGSDVLEECVASQVLADGVHYERSPMYHLHVLRDLALCAVVADCLGVQAPNGLLDAVDRMARFAGACRTRSGRLWAFNDATNGRCADLAGTRALLDAAGVSIAEDLNGWSSFDAGGFHLYRNALLELLVDSGVPGPPDQPGHAHCDALAVEMEFDGSPLFVNAGVSGYSGDRLRGYQRSTLAHNTVSVGGREQSELFGAFRTGRMAEVEGEVVGNGFRGRCSYFGPRGGAHVRTIRPVDRGVSIRDEWWGAARGETRAVLRVAPGWAARADGRKVRLDAEGARGRRLSLLVEGADDVRLSAPGSEHPLTTYAPEFGATKSVWAIIALSSSSAGELSFHLEW